MGIARRVRWYLNNHDVDYELIHHRHTESSIESADAAHIPSDQLAKCVILEDERGYLMAVLPASRRVAFEKLQHTLQRRLELAREGELKPLFDDCELGALPPIGNAYRLPLVLDERLLGVGDVYFEAGDHEDLVHMSGESFRDLMSGAQVADVSA